MLVNRSEKKTTGLSRLTCQQGGPESASSTSMVNWPALPTAAAPQVGISFFAFRTKSTPVERLDDITIQIDAEIGSSINILDIKMIGQSRVGVVANPDTPLTIDPASFACLRAAQYRRLGDDRLATAIANQTRVIRLLTTLRQSR